MSQQQRPQVVVVRRGCSCCGCGFVLPTLLVPGIAVALCAAVTPVIAVSLAVASGIASLRLLDWGYRVWAAAKAQLTRETSRREAKSIAALRRRPKLRDEIYFERIRKPGTSHIRLVRCSAPEDG